MCRRYIIGSSLTGIQKKFNVETPSITDWKKGQIITAGSDALLIAQDKPGELIRSTFGMIPAWSKKALPIINARAEGEKNPDNNPSFTGSKAIFRNPAFLKPLFSHRCLVIADAFIEWSATGNQQPYLVFLRNRERPFVMAGLYDTWTDPKTLDKHHTFTIITVPGNKLLRQLPYARMPVILEKGKEKRWLKPEISLQDILSQLQKYPSYLMNAYPIAMDSKNQSGDFLKSIQPAGSNVFPADDPNLRQAIRTNGFYHHKTRPSSNEPQLTLGERMELSRAAEAQRNGTQPTEL